jgi:uncharacterized membrane protein YfcA
VILAVLGAIAVGVTLGLLGSGGSILTVPILRYLLHHDHKAAIAESLVIVGVISAAGFLQALRAGRANPRFVVLFGVPGMLGGVGGALVAKLIPGPAQFVLLALLMLGAAYRMAASEEKSGSEQPLARSMPAMAALGAAVGCITGLVGVGGGFLIVPALVLFGRLPMSLAVGTSLGVIAMNCAVSFATYLITVRELDWFTVGLFGVIGVAGSVAGQRLSGRLPQRTVRRIFAVFLVLIALVVLWEELAHLT